MVDRLDEEKLETLRRWGAGLAEDTREELRAAGRAILILTDEIERLHVDLWHARDAGGSTPAPEAPGDGGAEAPPQQLEPALRERLAAAMPVLRSRRGDQ